MTFVRWAERDADTFAPSLYTKSRRRPSGEMEPGDGVIDGDGTVDPVVTPADGPTD